MHRHDRLSALDAAFVKLDRMGAPYHVGSIMVFDRRPLCTAAGALDQDRLRELIAACLDRLPRYRQRLGRIPWLRYPVWVDDEHLDLEHHVRFVCLRPPASPAQLDELAGRIHSLDLEPDRPPWQLWFVDGLEHEEVGVVAKVHHALLDGITGVRLLQEILRGVPDATLPPRIPWTPERRPGTALLREELAHRAEGLLTLRRRIPGEPRRLVRALGTLVARGLRPASDAGVNPRHIGRRRVMYRASFPLADVLRVKRARGVTVNDFVLAAVAGAARRFFLRRRIDLARLDDFRAMVPASTHGPADVALSGNRVALMLARLPIAEPDPVRRLARVHAVTSDLKDRADEVAAGELLVQTSDVTIPSLLPTVLGLSLSQRGFNLVVTNVAGPPFPLYLLGARMRRFHAIVNLWPRQTFAVAVLSYDGLLNVALNADPAAIPDFDGLCGDLEDSFGELCALGRLEVVTPLSVGAPAF